jgi:hypothetical protein
VSATDEDMVRKERKGRDERKHALVTEQGGAHAADDDVDGDAERDEEARLRYVSSSSLRRWIRRSLQRWYSCP